MPTGRMRPRVWAQGERRSHRRHSDNPMPLLTASLSLGLVGQRSHIGKIFQEVSA